HSPLAAGSSSGQSATLHLPNGAGGTGTIRFLVTVDSNHTLPEYDTQGNSAFGNNATTLDRTSTLAPYPDLHVENLTISPATGLQSGNTVTFNWDDVNGGTGPVTAGYTDTYQAYHVNANGSTTLIAVGYLTGTLGHNSATLHLPDGNSSAGT